MTFSTQERRQEVARTLDAFPRLSVQELSHLFSVSQVTIRKDLSWLEERLLVVRTHGGAVSRRSGGLEPAFAIREQVQMTAKERIARLASTLVQDGDTIALDASTTNLTLASFLKGRRELTVVTNGLKAAMELSSQSGISVLMAGGMLRQESLSLVGTWGTGVLEQIHIKTAFVGARGLTLEEGLTEVSSEEVAFKRALLSSVREVVALVDHTKWGQVALATFCPLERLKLVITDAQAPESIIQQMKKRGIDVWQAEM
ncbi:DeoR/GlpR family DNA-binding transcription regulator [Tengunoibacter tsumagoiensis]|uniref:DeoR family transcriptional regulator n=1 Tax=Tengunoibacter tsumagoiensis TaxID=2014871 RepID=A0A402A3P2_9CHLR|nr:DeoR/GlpR family DNA-binding transcription regulator [Tengunoibacter tsumagoiensis]GCE13778.1 DeoR family transcriptional regulator [Tengunoibacter tsumagoiensis]